MYDGQLSYNIWLSLPFEVRHKLVTLFDIPRSGRTVVEYRATGAVVTSDGFTAPDLQSISLSKMQSLLGSDSDNFYKLFEIVVTNLDALLGGTFVSPKQNVPDDADSNHDFSTESKLIDEKGETVYESNFAPTHEQVSKLKKKGGRPKKINK